MNKNPHQLAEERIGLAEEYSRYSGHYVEHVKKRAQFFKENRGNYKSDTATQRAYELTDEGITMEAIKYKLKSIEKQLSASATMLRLLENESRNLY